MGLLSEKIERYVEVGQTIVVNLLWRGQLYRLQMFFPGAKFPTRQEVTKQVQGIYPNAVVQTVFPATTDPTKPTIRVAKEGWSAKYKKSIDCDNPKGFSQRAHCQGRKKMSEEKDHEVSMAHSQLDKTIENAKKLKKKLGSKEKNLPAWVQAKITDTDHNMDAASSYTEETVSEEGLRDWFGKSKSKDGKKGWVNVVTGDSCASDKPGEGIPKCVSSSKRASMSKKERLAAAAAKRREDPGQQKKSGAAAPTMVKTDRKTRKEEHESMTEANIGFSNPAIKGKPVPYPKGHPEEGKPMSFNKAETEGKNKYDRYNRKHGTKIRADQPLPEEKIVEAKDKPGKGSGKKDACYTKVKSRYSVWPSAYASGALVKCRKVGAANWGNSKKEDYTYEFNDEYYDTLFEKCWSGYTEKGMKKKGDRMVPNCVPVKEERLDEEEYDRLKDKRLGGYDDKDDDDKEVRELDSIANRINAIRKSIKSRKKPTTQMNGYEPEGEVLEATSVPHTNVKYDKHMKKIVPSGGGVPVPRASKKVTTQMAGYEPEGEMVEGAAWTKKSGKNPSGGLNEKGRKSYERENPGSDLKAPSKKVGNKRRASFCARMKGMKKKLTSAKTANDPDSRINKSLRAWNC